MTPEQFNSVHLGFTSANTRNKHPQLYIIDSIPTLTEKELSSLYTCWYMHPHSKRSSLTEFTCPLTTKTAPFWVLHALSRYQLLQHFCITLNTFHYLQFWLVLFTSESQKFMYSSDKSNCIIWQKQYSSQFINRQESKRQSGRRANALLHNHFLYIINYRKHLSCFRKLYNTMTAQVLAFLQPCDLERTPRSFKLESNCTVQYTPSLKKKIHLQSPDKQQC